MLLAVWDMAVFAVVPVKGLGVAKRRLSTFLNPQQRKLLTVAMLEDVLNALKSSMVDEIVVVSNDHDIHQIVGKLGVSRVPDSRLGLNPTIEEATDWCMRKRANAVLVLPADIPLVSPKDINRIIALGSDGECVVLSPSLKGGTNAFFRKPPDLIRAYFGPKSFIKHVDECRRKGAKTKLYYSAEIAIDIDSAEDLKKLLEIENHTLCGRVLEQIGQIS